MNTIACILLLLLLRLFIAFCLFIIHRMSCRQWDWAETAYKWFVKSIFMNEMIVLGIELFLEVIISVYLNLRPE